MIKSCNALRTRNFRRNELRRPLPRNLPGRKLRSRQRRKRKLQPLWAMRSTPSMSSMTTTVQRLPPPRLRPPSQLLPSRRKSLPRNLKRLPLQSRRTRTSSLRASLPRVKAMMLLLPRMATVVAEVVAVADAMANGETVAITATGEVEIATTIGEVAIVKTIGEVAIVETVEDAAVTEGATAAAVAAIASQTRTKMASLRRLERSPSLVTEVTTEVTEETVVNLEEVTVATAMETAVTEMDTAVVAAVAVVADPKPKEVTTALPAKNNSQLLAKSERRQARTDKVKCE